MLFTGVASARFGAKRTLVGGLALIVLATALCALASDIGQLVGLRAVWGLGNAFFIATALSVIVGAATGGQKGAILLYEAALGLGLSVGPLLGALLGSFSWRGPFIGTAVLMAAAFFAVLAWSPFVLGWGAVEIGLVFFGWGACVAVSSVWLAPCLADRFGAGGRGDRQRCRVRPAQHAVHQCRDERQPGAAAGLPVLGRTSERAVPTEAILVGEDLVG